MIQHATLYLSNQFGFWFPRQCRRHPSPISTLRQKLFSARSLKTQLFGTKMFSSSLLFKNQISKITSFNNLKFVESLKKIVPSINSYLHHHVLQWMIIV